MTNHTLDVDNGANAEIQIENQKNTLRKMILELVAILMGFISPHAPPLMSLLSAWMEDHLHNPPKTWSRLDAQGIFSKFFANFFISIHSPRRTLKSPKSGTKT